MFGTNVITGKSFFKDAPIDSLFVTSMFFTLQGEGPYAGIPALFIRLTKCNLSCSFCDTFFDDGEWMTYGEITARIEKTIIEYWGSRNLIVPNWIMDYQPAKEFLHITSPVISEISKFNCVLVVTGGEPMLQPNLAAFLEVQASKFKAIQIETNGTVDQTLSDNVTVVCSPKCSEKNGVPTKYLAPSKFILNRADCLKFVMSSDVTSPYGSVPEWAHQWKRDNPTKEIYCSPMNIYNDFPQKIKLLRAEKGTITMAERSTVDEKINFFEPGLINMDLAQKNHEHVGKYCMEHGFRMQMQMHLFANLA